MNARAQIDALCGQAGAHARAGQVDEALKLYEIALAAFPHDAEIAVDVADMLTRLGRCSEAVDGLRRLLAADPRCQPALYLLGKALWELRDHDAALKAFQAAAVDAPEFDPLIDQWAFARLGDCAWSGYEAMTTYFDDLVRAGRNAVRPFRLMLTSGSPALLAQCARTYATEGHPAQPPLWSGKPWRHERIRIGYVTAELYDHPVAHLLAGVLEHHDRTAFELTAFSICPPNDAAIRKRVIAAFDEVVEVGHLDDAAIAREIHGRQIDIAVTLSGYTGDCRPSVMAWRPAPVQVSYQGFPGTMGAPYIDYLIADRHVVAEDETDDYDEKIVWMPDTYQPTDDAAPIATRTPSRADEGLPDAAFVFMAYNKAYKIAPVMFETWMRILGRVENSVLWLASGSPATRDNLRREAALRGVDPGRLVFAAVKPERADHLARHRLADLFLDTLPYNAHSTASDALWAGLPVLTCRGTTFPGRVCAGLLSAAGLADLIVESLDEYERLAVDVAQDPDRLAALRARVEGAAHTSALFDTAGYTRALEAAFRAMHEASQRGRAPSSFAVERSEPAGDYGSRAIKGSRLRVSAKQRRGARVSRAEP